MHQCRPPFASGQSGETTKALVFPGASNDLAVAHSNILAMGSKGGLHQMWAGLNNWCNPPFEAIAKMLDCATAS